MRPIQANSDFFQNHSGTNAVVTLSIHNPNAVPMPILSAPGGAAVMTLPPGSAITSVFLVAAGGVLHSDLPGGFQFHNVVF